MVMVNAMGDACPIPVIKTKKAIQALTEPDTIEVLVDNEIAVKNVSKMAASEGGSVSAEQLGEGEYRVTIVISDKKSSQAKDGRADLDSETVCIDDCCTGKNTVVVIASDRMGEGNDELGKVLMKGFIFAVTQLEELPKTILFYNGGSETFGRAGCGDFDLWNLSGLLWIERQALCRKCYKYVYDCRDYECGR